MNRQQAYQARHRAAGLCTECAEFAVSGHVLCTKHLENIRVHNREYNRKHSGKSNSGRVLRGALYGTPEYDAQRKFLVLLYARGVSSTILKTAFGVAQCTITAIARRAGVKTRGVGRPRKEERKIT